MKRIGIIGNGKTRRAASLLEKQNFTVVIADSVQQNDCVSLDATDKKQLMNFARDKEALVSCGPYFVNKTIAEVCSELNIAYFDPTEDTEIATVCPQHVGSTTMMTLCGLGSEQFHYFST